MVAQDHTYSSSHIFSCRHLVKLLDICAMKIKELKGQVGGAIVSIMIRKGHLFSRVVESSKK